MKEYVYKYICGIVGFTGSTIASFFGGWDKSVSILVIFMIIDYVSGLVVAGVFKQSPKTNYGALESRACWKGICRKVMTLVIVGIACKLEQLTGMPNIRDTVAIAFITSETISIVENAGLMGIKVPDMVTNAIDLLIKRKGE